MSWLEAIVRALGFYNKPPVNFQRFTISGNELRDKLIALGYMVPLGMMDSSYTYTDAEGWASIIEDMTFNSNLYKSEIFDCDDYAMKAYVTCRERYGLNGLGLVLGMTPAGYHGFNIIFTGDGFFLHEPNEGFHYGGPFPIGEHGYFPNFIVY